MKIKAIIIFTVIFVVIAIMGIPAGAAESLKAGLAADVGKIDDKTFNEAAYKRMMRAAKEFGLNIYKNIDKC